MAKCENCGAEVTDKMKFCSECGTRVPTDKECPACHTRCALAAKFCSECGHDFSKPVEEDADEEDDSNEEDASSSGHYSVILKDCGENKGAVLRDLVEMTGKRLWPDISDMVNNLPAVVAEGLTRDKADRYYGGLLLDGAQAEVVADGDGGGEDDSDEEEDSPSEPYPEMVDIPGRNFKLGRTPVTQAQWKAVMGSNPSYFTYSGTNRPVENVSWNDCQEFIEKLNEETGMNFRLPTQDEWEYACLAGSTGEYGLVEGGEEGELDDMGWYEGNSDDETHPVAQKQPNAWGLYDMHGNVATWCSDTYGGASDYHVVCGGGFCLDADSCGATYRSGIADELGDNWIGLRLAMDCDSDTDEETSEEETSEEEESSSDGASRKSRTCAVFLKDIGSDKNAVIRELRTLLNKTFAEAKGLVEQRISPKPLHLDCPREKAEEIAAALEAVGATVEISDKDLGTVTSGNCSVVIKKLPFMMGRGDRMGVACVIAEAEGCMPANAWKMLDNLPLTFARNISREEAEEIASKIEARKCKVEIV